MKVPKENLMGPLNGGWTVGKRLLQFERSSIASSLAGPGNFGQSVALPSAADAAKKYVGLDENGRMADRDLRHRITLHMMESKAFQLTVKRAAGDAGPSNTAAIMKYMAAKIAQERTELLIEAMGQNGLGWSGEGFSQQELAAMRRCCAPRPTQLKAAPRRSI